MLSLDTITFNSALSTCEKGSQWLPAMKLLQSMDTTKVEMDVISASAALCALERSSKWEDVLLHRQNSFSNQAPVVSLGIRALGQESHWQAARELLREEYKQSMQPDVKLLGCSVSLFAKAATWHLALDQLDVAACMDTKADHVAITAATSAHLSASQWQLPMLLLGTAMWRDAAGVSLVLSGLEKATCWQMASLVFHQSPAQRVRPSTVSCNAAIAAASSVAWQQSHLMMSQLQRHTVKSDAVTFASCTTVGPAEAAPGSPGLWNISMWILDQMKSRAVCANTVVIGTVMTSLEGQQRWQQALDIVRVVARARMILNGVQVGTLAACMHQAAGPRFAREFLENMRQVWLEAEVCTSNPELRRTSHQVIAEMPGIFAISKPYGSATEQVLRQLQGELRCRLSIASRLDYGTSGVLPIAVGSETSTATRWLQAQFAARVVHKHYMCLCAGDRQLTTNGRLKTGIRTVAKGLQAWVSEVSQEGSVAVTEYAVCARYEDPRNMENRFCLLSVQPLTGRTHQIRVHMASIGLPIVGDAQYGKRAFDTNCQRLFLHCYKLQIMGLDGRLVHLTAELPQELELTLAQLQLIEGTSAFAGRSVERLGNAREMCRRT